MNQMRRQEEERAVIPPPSLSKTLNKDKGGLNMRMAVVVASHNQGNSAAVWIFIGEKALLSKPSYLSNPLAFTTRTGAYRKAITESMFINTADEPRPLTTHEAFCFGLMIDSYVLSFHY